MINSLISATYTDQYQLAMAQVYFNSPQRDQTAVFDYFFRKLPFQGGYAIFAGLETLLDILSEWHFSQQDIAYLKDQGFQQDFLDYLTHFRFTGSIHAMKEGEVVFPNTPMMRIEGNLIEVQMIETLLLNFVNFQTLIATKAARIRDTAPQATLLELGLRRAQGLGGFHAARAAMIGGFNGTSNVMAAKTFDIPAVGTMAHAFIQSYNDELTAFRRFAEQRPQDCVLLVDTYDTLNSGLPNAITVAQEMQQCGQQLKAIRLDSGDLAYLSKRARCMLDQAGLHHVKIAVSNQLDEHLIKSLLEQQAPIDIYGVGTSLAIGHPDAALDGVYKMARCHDQSRIKLSENKEKTTLPDRKTVYRLLDQQHMFAGDVITLMDDKQPIKMMHHPFDPFKSRQIHALTQQPLLDCVFDQGKRCQPCQSIQSIADYRAQRLAQLPAEHKRFNYPHVYKIGISTTLKQQRDALIQHYKNKDC